MARKKGTKASSLGGGEVTKETIDGDTNGVERIASLFTTMQEKGVTWYGREREGIALIEGFQSALLVLRDAPAVAEIAADRGNEKEREKEGATVLCGLAGNLVMDPWLAENLFEQVQLLSSRFEELLEEMCMLQAQARKIGA